VGRDISKDITDQTIKLTIEYHYSLVQWNAAESNLKLSVEIKRKWYTWTDFT